MKKFSVILNNDVLIIEHRLMSRLFEFSGKLITFFASLLIYLFPYHQVIALNKYLFMIYLIPLIPLIRIIPGLYYFFNGNRFEFNRKTDQFLLNNKCREKISNIKLLEWNTKEISDSIEYNLDIRTLDNRIHRISTTIFGLNNEHLLLGRQMAKFLKIRFINNDPREQEILWENNYVDENSIRQIDNSTL